MQRREFLQSSTSFAALAFFNEVWALSTDPKPAHFLVTAHLPDVVKPVEPFKTLDHAGEVHIFDVSRGEMVRKFPIPIYAHSFNPLPKNPNKSVAVAKWTNSAALIDLQEGRVEQTIRAPKDYRFFGHGVFSPGGDHFFATASSPTAKGAVLVFDTSTWKNESIIPIGRRYPHECVRVSDQRIAIAGYVESKGFVKILDSATGKIVRTYDTPRAAHLDVLDQDRLIVCGGSPHIRPELFVLNLKNSEVLKYESSHDFKRTQKPSEALSLCVLSPNKVAVTLRHSDQLMLWDIQKNHLRLYDLKEPYGVARVGNQLFINAGDGSLRKLDPAGITGVPSPFSSIGNGLHMYAAFL